MVNSVTHQYYISESYKYKWMTIAQDIGGGRGAQNREKYVYYTYSIFRVQTYNKLNQIFNSVTINRIWIDVYIELIGFIRYIHTK